MAVCISVDAAEKTFCRSVQTWHKHSVFAVSEMGDADPLFELRNLYLVGNYQAAINAGLSLGSLPERVQVERDVLIYRAYIAKGDCAIVLGEIKNNAANPLQAVRCLATYLSKDQDIALASIKEWLSEPHLANDEHIQLIAGTIYFYKETTTKY